MPADYDRLDIKQAFARYFQSLAELAGIETQGTSQVRLTGLSDVAHKFGRESSELRDAKEMMRLSVDVSPPRCPRQAGHKLTEIVARP
jgi:hypothetical protein